MPIIPHIMNRFLSWGLVIFLMTCIRVDASAQQALRLESSQSLMTRSELEGYLAQLSQIAESRAYSGQLRSQARLEAAAVERRLTEGDLQVGDRVRVFVEGQPRLPDSSYAVESGRLLNLPDLPPIELRGVLRSELEGHIKQFLTRYLRSPVVRAESLIRISVFGSVGTPGFYAVPSELQVGDAIMRAGGPSQTAKFDEVRIERAGQVVWDGVMLQQAIIDGRTLDQLNVMAGDQIFVPDQGTGIGGVETTIRTVTLLIGLPLSIFALTQIF